MINDLKSGKNSECKIHEYKYDDTSYELRYAYDYILNNQTAREEHGIRKQLENLENM